MSRSISINKPSATTLNDSSSNIAAPSASSTILDTLKKKMNQLKEELETSRDELERCRQNLDEEKRRRECVSALKNRIGSNLISTINTLI